MFKKEDNQSREAQGVEALSSGVYAYQYMSSAEARQRRDPTAMITGLFEQPLKGEYQHVVH